MEQKQCKSCSTNFTIEDEDLKFYDKISPTFDGKKFQIPPPTLCPDCRSQRRMAHTNHMNLYKRKCDATGKDIISTYHPDSPYKVYQMEYWASDKWDALRYGRDFDFNRSFFEQFDELVLAVPHQALFHDFVNDINCDYTNYAGKNKDCYMIFDSDECQECLFDFGINNSKNAVDCARSQNLEICYENVDCFNNYNCRYCYKSESCTDSAFLYNCASCKNCLFCINLRHKEFYVFNEKVSEEEYEKIRKLLGSYKSVQGYIKKFKQLQYQFPHKYLHGVKNENVSGNYIVESKNAKHCFDYMKLWDCKYCNQVFMGLKDSMDVDECGDSELIYEGTMVGYNAYNCLFTNQAFNQLTNIYYSNQCFRSSDLFGCIGLSKQKYCILNKQYSEEEYNKMVVRIIKHMQKTGEWGEFFPIKSSAFPYNASSTSVYFPLSKEEVLKNGGKWQEEDKKEYQKQTYEISDNIEDVNEDILKAVLACNKCGKNYKIVQQEYNFYKFQKIPIPRECFHCRHQDRIDGRTPRILWKRKCMCDHKEHESHRGNACPVEFETAYSPQRPEIVYCEECYLKEIV
jgi:hypothetical protein